MRKRVPLMIGVGVMLVVPLAVTALSSPAAIAAAPPALSHGSVVLVGAEAATFRAPGDVAQLWQATYPDGTVQTRYQQMVGDASVLGGQLTTIQRGSRIDAVIGAYFPGLTAKNARTINGAQARAAVERRIGALGQWSVSLMIDPSDARLFHRVENRRPAQRWIHWIDAGNGAVRNAYDAITYDGPGTGVKGDTKQLDTSVQGGTNVLVSSDGRQATYDAQNTQNFNNRPGILFADADDIWNLAGRTSPGQPAGVDAHFYADVTDQYYSSAFGRDSLDDNGMQMVSSAHFGRNYNNAFWDGAQMTYGDGDRRNFREFSGALDVVAHELTHGVTEFTSDLIYENESGALNESFSDILGNSAEFFAAANGLDPAASPDWLVGEDIVLAADAVPGIRNMGDPQEDLDPDHYSEFIVTTEDNGGVHSNSAIPNHAYYLLVNGGRNAGCDNVGSSGHQHAVDCDIVVSGVGVTAAQAAFYLGFTSLPEHANICDARNATVAVGGAISSNVSDAWAAVGVKSGCTPAPPPPPCGDPNATIPFESDHPYTNNLDCTWTYDHGSPNFALHFDLLDVENNFDFVVLTDGNGVEVARYTGALHGPAQTTPCITTSVVHVRLLTDASVVDQGFIVDAAVAC